MERYQVVIQAENKSMPFFGVMKSHETEGDAVSWACDMAAEYGLRHPGSRIALVELYRHMSGGKVLVKRLVGSGPSGCGRPELEGGVPERLPDSLLAPVPDELSIDVGRFVRWPPGRKVASVAVASLAARQVVGNDPGCLAVLLLDEGLALLGGQSLAVEEGCATLVSPCKLFRLPVILGAAGVIAAVNGWWFSDELPLIRAARGLCLAARHLGLRPFDFLVLGGPDGEAVSFLRRGYLPMG